MADGWESALSARPLPGPPLRLTRCCRSSCLHTPAGAVASATMYEALLFLDEHARAVIEAAAAFVAEHGLQVTHRAPFSVAFVEPEHVGDLRLGSHGPAAMPQNITERRRISLTETSGQSGSPASAGGPGREVLPAGAGQIAAVPIQVRPEWSRVWVMAAGEGKAARVAAAYVARERPRSERLAGEVRALEAGALSPARWPEIEAGLRANLRRQGLDEVAIESRVATFRQRWLALGRAAGKTPPEEPVP